MQVLDLRITAVWRVGMFMNVVDRQPTMWLRSTIILGSRAHSTRYLTACLTKHVLLDVRRNALRKLSGKYWIDYGIRSCFQLAKVSSLLYKLLNMNLKFITHIPFY